MIPRITSLATVQPEPVDWLWPGRIPLGKLTLLEGNPGIGKSLLLLDLAARLTTGREMPDGRRGDLGGPAGVVLLAGEDGLADTVRPRLEAAGGDAHRVAVLAAVVADDGAEDLPALPHDIEALRQAIRHVAAKLVIIDPLSAYLGADIDPWKDSSVRRALTPLGALAEDTGAAIVAVRHWVKAAATPALYKGQGSMALAGAARQVLCVAPHPDDPETMVLASVKANLSRRPASLGYRVEEAAYVYPDGGIGHVPRVRWLGEVDIEADDLAMAAPGGREPSPERAAVIAYVAGRGEPVTADEVAQALGITRDNARAHLSRAAKAGQLIRTKTGRYAIPLSQSQQSYLSQSHGDGDRRPTLDTDPHQSHVSQSQQSYLSQSHIPSSGVTDVTDVTCDRGSEELSQPRCRCGGVLQPAERDGWLRCKSCQSYVRAGDPALRRHVGGDR